MVRDGRMAAQSEKTEVSLVAALAGYVLCPPRSSGSTDHSWETCALPLRRPDPLMWAPGEVCPGEAHDRSAQTRSTSRRTLLSRAVALGFVERSGRGDEGRGQLPAAGGRGASADGDRPGEVWMVVEIGRDVAEHVFGPYLPFAW